MPSVDIHVSVRYSVDLQRQEKAQIWLLIPISDNNRQVNAFDAQCDNQFLY